MNTRILVAGEKNLPQDVISSYLENDHNFVLTKTANNGYLSRSILTTKPDILLLELLNADMSDVSSILWLRRTFPGLLIISVFMRPDKAILAELFKNGVFGYILYKDLAEIKDAIRAVNNHKLYLSRGILQLMAEDLASNGNGEESGLELHPDRLAALLNGAIKNQSKDQRAIKGGYYSDELDRIVHKWLLHSLAQGQKLSNLKGA